MKTQLALMMALFVGILSAQAEMNFSYEMKFGDGKQVTGTASNSPVASDYNYFENLLDINTNLGGDIYIYTQFEYSNLPVYGSPADRLSAFYLEYQNDKFPPYFVL